MPIIIGQEAVCPDGLGRVVKFELWNDKPHTITVKTYIDDRSCDWGAHNVKLIDPHCKHCIKDI